MTRSRLSFKQEIQELIEKKQRLEKRLEFKQRALDRLAAWCSDCYDKIAGRGCFRCHLQSYASRATNHAHHMGSCPTAAGPGWQNDCDSCEAAEMFFGGAGLEAALRGYRDTIPVPK